MSKFDLLILCVCVKFFCQFCYHFAHTWTVAAFNLNMCVFMALLTFLNCSFGFFTCDILLTESGNFCWLCCVVQGGNKMCLLNCKTSKVLLMLYSEPYKMTASLPKLSRKFAASVYVYHRFLSFLSTRNLCDLVFPWSYIFLELTMWLPFKRLQHYFETSISLMCVTLAAISENGKNKS